MLKMIKENPAVAISVFCFLLALTQNAFCVKQGAECKSAFEALLLGPLVIIGGGSALTWLANPLLVFTWIFVEKKAKTSFFVSIAATLIALSFMLFERAMISSAGDAAISSYGAGYYLWILSSTLRLS